MAKPAEVSGRGAASTQDRAGMVLEIVSSGHPQRRREAVAYEPRRSAHRYAAHRACDGNAVEAPSLISVRPEPRPGGCAGVRHAPSLRLKIFRVQRQIELIRSWRFDRSYL